MTTFTPGPWMTDGIARQPYVGDDGKPHRGAIAVFAGEGVACVALVVPGCLPATGRGDAAPSNARLIAAAPTMLDALRDLLAACEAEVNEKGGGGYILARMSDAKAAIALAIAEGV